MKYKCRAILPQQTTWIEVESASPEDAAQNFLYDRLHLSATYIWRKKGSGGEETREDVHFAQVEVEGTGPLFARVYRCGIYRKGGIRRSDKTLEWIAAAIGYTHDPKTLLDPWDHEEAEWT